MVPLDASIGSLGNWKQLGFVAPDAKAMMDRLTAVGFGPFKVYHVDSGDWEGVTYRGAPAERYALEVCMASGTWDVEIIVPIPGGGRTARIACVRRIARLDWTGWVESSYGRTNPRWGKFR